jgi:hypothetical protein
LNGSGIVDVSVSRLAMFYLCSHNDIFIEWGFVECFWYSGKNMYFFPLGLRFGAIVKGLSHLRSWVRFSFQTRDIRDLTSFGRQRDDDGQNKLLQINGSKDSSSYIINRMNLIQS